MTPPLTLTRQDGPPSFFRRLRAAHFAAVAAVALILVVAAALSSTAPVIDRITVVNPTPYDVLVEVRGASGGWSTVGYADRAGTTVAERISDQGERWTFRFSGQGRTAGQLALSRSELEAAKWRIVVPPAVAAALEAEGAPPSP